MASAAPPLEAPPLPPADEDLVVDQAIDGAKGGRFWKSIHRVSLERGAIYLVRKRDASRPAAEASPRGALLLVHGYAQNRYAWHIPGRSLANFLAAEGVDVWSVDLRGGGRSAEERTPRARAFHDLVDDVLAAMERILAVTGEARLFLAGHSLGGACVEAAAGARPDAVRGVVTLAGLHAFAQESAFLRLLGRLAERVERSGLLRRLLPDPLPTDLVGRILSGTRGAWDSAWAGLAPLAAWSPGSIEPALLATLIRLSFEPASLGITLALGAMARGLPFADARGQPYLAPFERLPDMPLLVVAGAEDGLVAPSDSQAAYLRSASRDRTWRLFGGRTGERAMGHMDLLLGDEAPRTVWPLLGAWLRER